MKCIIFGLILLVGLCQAEIPTKIPDLDDFEAVKERCDKKGGPGVYEKLKVAAQETQTCIKGLIDVEKVKNEVEEAKKTGSMDEVFGKYCGKRPQINECIKKSRDAIQPCLEENEKKALNLTENIITKIVDFACYKDGDRIAMFIAEGGVECLNSRVESIKNCVNQTVKFNPATFSPNSIPDLTIDKKKCDDLTAIQNCIVNDLETNCSDTTPSNIVDALFRFVKKTACKDAKPKRSISLKRATRGAIKNHQVRFRRQLEEKMKIACQINGKEGAFEKFMTSYNESQACLKNYRIFVTPLNVYQRILASCTTSARNSLKDCLSEEEKFAPDFALELVQSLFGFIYSYNVKFSASRELEIETANCLGDLQRDELQKELLSCLNQTETHKLDTKKVITVLPKLQLCEKLKNANICISSVVKTTCINDIKAKKLLDDFVASVEAPCQIQATAENEA